MKPLPSIAGLATCLIALAAAAQTSEKVITNSQPASAASSPDAVRTQKFNTHHRVPASLTLRGTKPVMEGWSAQYRFAGQTAEHTCTLHLPKKGQVVKPGETALGTIQCSTPWQLYDNGLAFEARQDGRKVADGTLRP